MQNGFHERLNQVVEEQQAADSEAREVRQSRISVRRVSKDVWRGQRGER